MATIKSNAYKFRIGSFVSKESVLLLIVLILPGLIFVIIRPEDWLFFVSGVIVLALGVLHPKWLLYLIIALLPFDVLLPVFKIPFLAVKSTTANALIFISIIVYLLLLTQRRIRFQWTVTTIFFSLFVLWNFCSAWWSIDQSKSLYRSIEWLLFWGFLIVLSGFLTNVDSIKIPAFILSFASIVIIILSVLDRQVSVSGRFLGIYDNPNNLGTMLVFCSLGVFLRPFFIKKNWGGFLVFFYLIIATILTLLSASRGSVLGIAVILSGLLFLGKQKKTLRIGLFVLIAIMLITQFFPSTYRVLFERIQDTDSDFLGGRVDIYNLAINLIKEKPIFGYGSGTGTSIMGTSFYSELGVGEVGLGKSVHNPLLEIWVENGIIGLFLFLVAIFYPVIRATQYVLLKKAGSNTAQLFLKLILISYLGYLSLWIKNGGATHDKNIYLYIAALAIFVYPFQGNIEEK